MISVSRANFLRTTPSEELVSEFSNYTSHQFSNEGVPVLIAARNEQEDLPATLISLAYSGIDVRPIVIENGSDDETARRAMKMGATVLHSDMPFKLAALQEGVQMLDDQDRIYDKPLLFTDADTLVGRNWSETMANAALTPNEKLSRVVCGSAIIWNGPSMAIDTLRTANAIVKDTLSSLRGTEPIGRGHNMAINFANEDAIDMYANLDPTLFIAEEQAIMDAIKRTGGEVVQSLGLKSIVLTRGDRFETLRDCFGVKGDTTRENRKQLYPEYDGITPYTP